MKSINLTGTAGKPYNLDEIQTSKTRTASDEELLVQIWYWNPDGIESYKENLKKYEEHKYPNPPDPKVGQIWLSKLVKKDFVEEEV